VQRVIDVEMGLVDTSNNSGSKKRGAHADYEDNHEEYKDDDFEIKEDVAENGVPSTYVIKPAKKKKKATKNLSTASVGSMSMETESKMLIEKDPFFVDEASSDIEEAFTDKALRPYGQSWKHLESRKNANLHLSRGDLVRKQSAAQKKTKVAEKELTKQELRLLRWKEKKRGSDGRGTLNTSLIDEQRKHSRTDDYSSRKSSSSKWDGGPHKNTRPANANRKPQSYSSSVQKGENAVSYGGISASNTSEMARLKGKGAIVIETGGSAKHSSVHKNKKIVFNSD